MQDDYYLTPNQRKKVIVQLNEAVISGNVPEIKRILNDYKHEYITLERIECDTLEKCTFTDELLETLLEFNLPFEYIDPLLNRLNYDILLKICRHYSRKT